MLDGKDITFISEHKKERLGIVSVLSFFINEERVFDTIRFVMNTTYDLLPRVHQLLEPSGLHRACTWHTNRQCFQETAYRSNEHRTS